jgi:hypothetical protein
MVVDFGTLDLDVPGGRGRKRICPAVTLPAGPTRWASLVL